MSIAAYAWARQQKAGSPTAKALLVALADYADADGAVWLPLERIVALTEMSLGLLLSEVGGLAARGLVHPLAIDDENLSLALPLPDSEVSRRRFAAEDDKQCHVYVFATLDADGGHCAPIKVGITGSVRSRLHAVNTASHSRIGLLCSYALPSKIAALAVERRSHAALAEFRRNGEWFDVEPDRALRAVERVIGSALQ